MAGLHKGPAQRKINKISTPNSEITAVYEQELGDCLQSDTLSSKITVGWADNKEPGLREKASKKVRHSKESTRSSTQIRNMMVLCEQELGECPQLEALSSEMTVLWADNGEPSVRNMQ